MLVYIQSERENMDQNNSEYGHFWRSDYNHFSHFIKQNISQHQI